MQLGVLKSVTAGHLALCSEGISFLLGELPHIKGRIELAVPDAKKSAVEDSMTLLKTALASHRDDLYTRISSFLAGGSAS
ncbi:MAG: hypothetical protein P4M11_13995 [Candidatus Pacebacteria bacterium]|nr:hypothetical protein [Candidatus Paceibacterota bacterium]